MKTKHGLEARGIKNINIIIDEESEATYVNNLKNKYRSKKVLPESLQNDDKIRTELLVEMSKHWAIEEKDFDHLVMLSTYGQYTPESIATEGSSDGRQLEEAVEVVKMNNLGNDMVAKSMFVFDVKPIAVETNLEELALTLKELKFDGLVTWGVEHQLIPVAFGLYKLRISVVVEDDKVSQEHLEELINSDGRGDEIISSVDLYVESKVKLPWDEK